MSTHTSSMQTWSRSSSSHAGGGDVVALRLWPGAEAWRPGGGSDVAATGHQAFLWHPGILAKDMVTCAIASRTGGRAVHLVVDHDVHEAMTLDLPVRRDGRLGVHRVRLGRCDAAIPTGMQPAADRDAVLAVLRSTVEALGGTLAVDVQPMIDAWDEAGGVAAGGDGSGSLAAQIAGVVDCLRGQWVGRMDVRLTSALSREAAFERFVGEMVDDAHACVGAYNRAVAALPEAGLAPLYVSRTLVELPLWLVGFGRPRAKVYADVSGGDAWLVDASGERIDVTSVCTGAGGSAGRGEGNGDGRGDGGDVGAKGWRLAPRALSLTAYMRRWGCGLFVHGTGGGVYDRVMERWMSQWRGEALSPCGVATADAFLRFDVPVADAARVSRAKWRRHHLPHNIDRHVDLSGDGRAGALASEKRWILEAISRDQARGRRAERERRAALFDSLQMINHELAAMYDGVIDEADRAVRDAVDGVANARVAGRRDWCFGLYPSSTLKALADAVGEAVDAMVLMGGAGKAPIDAGGVDDDAGRGVRVRRRMDGADDA